MNKRDAIEPRGCIALRLEEIVAVIDYMADHVSPASSNYALYMRFQNLKRAVIKQGGQTVPALVDVPVAVSDRDKWGR